MGSDRPSDFNPAKIQLDAVSPPRWTSVSMTFLALYFCSAGSALNSVSRAGLLTAYSPARRTTPNTTSVASTGDSASAAKPTIATTGIAHSMNVVPRRRISAPNANTCTASVSRLTAMSTSASSRVRSALSEIAAGTSSVCWK